MKEMPVAPIYIYTNTRLVHPMVQGWHANLMDYHHYGDVHIAPAKGP
jgi:ABC-type oligopeptide transport system substrate-binding subunit